MRALLLAFLILVADPPAPPPSSTALLLPPAPVAPAAEQKLARELLAQLVGLDTSAETGTTTKAAQLIVRRLRDAGFPAADIFVGGPSPGKQNLVVRLRGTGRGKPLLLLGHLDVVQALPTDWSLPPYQLTEKDGYFYGRGTQDMKGQVAIWLATLLRMRRERVAHDRDVIVALTADEERGASDENGVQWLLAHAKDRVDAELALNEGGGGEIKAGKRRANDVQASEKGYLSFRLEVRDKGGHSSLPTKENAIVHLSEALARLGRYQFPARVDPVIRLYFERMATVENGQVAADMRTVSSSTGAPDAAAVARLSALPYYNARLRTTCSPTRLEGGHADNALPQLATALVNCRLLPGDTQEGVTSTLKQVLADPAVSVVAKAPLEQGPVGPPPPDFLRVVEQVSSRSFPGIPVVPVMSTGATDGRFLRAAGIPTYGLSGLFSDVDDVRAHGRDERMLVQAFYEAQQFVWELVTQLAGRVP
jgi:acetylornithine deacetylase/succinyl-diaminopimelate desuccinylase-like protein